MLTTRQIELIESSWEYVVHNSNETGILYFKELFEIDPQLSKLFTDDLKTQPKKLMDMITFVVQKLRNIGDIVASIKNVGIHREHFPAIAFALLLTLDKILGEENSSEIMEAWTAACIKLAKSVVG
jgi:hemoglobin-like flavoprotein